jgi:hypothetical protein
MTLKKVLPTREAPQELSHWSVIPVRVQVVLSADFYSLLYPLPSSGPSQRELELLLFEACGAAGGQNLRLC